MSILWNKLIECQNTIIDIFDKNCKEIEEPGLDAFNQPDKGWINRVWCNESVRRAHIDVVDARDTKGLWMMHVCVFPVLNNSGPIYGFDVIAGRNKMTGAFHDFSHTVDKKHPMLVEFDASVKDFIPSKERNLPQWAKNIFSPNMLAAGNVQTEDEASDIIQIAINNLKYYFQEIGNYNMTADTFEVIIAQNYYCQNQQQNPHTAKVMKSLGLPEQDVEIFCKDMLFPELNYTVPDLY